VTDQPDTTSRDAAAGREPAAGREDHSEGATHAEVPDRWRRVALAVAIARYVIPLAAIPAIPFLLRDRVPLLVLLRPQKEFLLLGAGQSRYLGEPAIWQLVLAFLPLGLLAVPAFFVIGRAYRRSLLEGDGPSWLTRAIPPRQIELAQRVLARRGPAIAVLGRLAAFPPTVLAAAAGLSDVSARRYLVADAIGAVVATGATLAAGYALGRAYEDGGVWLTVAGVALFVTLIGLLTFWIRREAARED
jgi:membrane protein DedA with SNARE-associated domain